MNDDSKNARYTFNIFGRTGNCVVSNTRPVPILDNPKNHRCAIEAFTLTSSESFADTIKLIFETSSLPLVQINLSSDFNIQRKQVGEYYLSKSDSDAKNNYIQYRADVYQEYDLDSMEPLRTLDLFVYKQSTTGVITPVKIDANSGLSLTLVFIRK